jgi:hypothetical protein
VSYEPINYHQALEVLIHARAAQIERHLPAEMPDDCPGCGKWIKYASYINVRSMWALHLAEETFRS